MMSIVNDGLLQIKFNFIVAHLIIVIRWLSYNLHTAKTKGQIKIFLYQESVFISRQIIFETQFNV